MEEVVVMAAAEEEEALGAEGEAEEDLEVVVVVVLVAVVLVAVDLGAEHPPLGEEGEEDLEEVDCEYFYMVLEPVLSILGY